MVSSNEMSNFSEDTDEDLDTEEIAGTSLETYQFEPIDANASNTDQLTEDESSYHLIKSYLGNYSMI